MLPLPGRDAQRHPSRRVLPCRLRLRGQVVGRVLEGTGAVARGIVPGGRQQQGGGGKLRHGQGAPAPGQGRAKVLRQAPACVEGRPMHMRAMAGEDRLDPQGRGPGVNRRRAVQQVPGADRRSQDGYARPRVIRPEMPASCACRGCRVGLDHNRQARMQVARRGQHGAKRGVACPQQGRIPRGLVDDQHERTARQAVGQWCRGVEGIVLRQVPMAQRRDGILCACRQARVIQRVRGQQRFHIGRRGGVKMHPGPVKQQPQRRRGGAGMDRPQERILDPQDRVPGPRRHRLAPARCRAAAPDAHPVIGPARRAQRHPPARARQDAPHARLCQEAAVVNEKTPGSGVPGVRFVACRAHYCPASVCTEAAAFRGVSSAPRTLANCE